jgi:hypothetical protein
MNACIPAMNPFAQVPASLRRGEKPRTRIAYGQVFSRLLEEAETLRFRVISGHLWLTMEGGREDHLLTSGQTIAIEGPGRLVAEGIEDGALVEIA